MAKMTRRDWIKAFGSLVPATTFIAACQQAGPQGFLDAPGGPDSPPGCSASDPTVVIMDNHAHAPHACSIPMADVQAPPQDRMYGMKGMANHDHMITITMAQFQMLQAAGTVMDTSTMTVCHTHVLVISCA